MSTGAVYCISDLHLDDSRPWVIEAFEAFLDEHRDAAALYILGDLFEYWVGDDEDSALSTRVTEALAAYSATGPRLYLMHGNRDFMLGERFERRTGAELLPEPSVMEAHGQRCLLMHGDSLCTRDTDYQAFRAQARTPEWKAQALAQPLEKRHALAAQLRTVSRDAGSRKAADIMDVTEDEVLSTMREHDCAVLIHGHTHRPARHDNDCGVRWVLGDWDSSGWWLRLDKNGIELKEFDINQ